MSKGDNGSLNRLGGNCPEVALRVNGNSKTLQNTLRGPFTWNVFEYLFSKQLGFVTLHLRSTKLLLTPLDRLERDWSRRHVTRVYIAFPESRLCSFSNF